MLEAYRLRLISESEIKQALGFGTRMEVHAFLKEHGTNLQYDMEEWQEDLKTLRSLHVNSLQA